ncbi:hypothetical protein ARTHRO9V_140019 [Arthrobacter sp. 9V]|nr:hypothetical protein ARTHRO9V_140019 [Arthrobacter sp. 9V]
MSQLNHHAPKAFPNSLTKGVPTQTALITGYPPVAAGCR